MRPFPLVPSACLGSRCCPVTCSRGRFMKFESLLRRTILVRAMALTVAVATGCDSTPTAPSMADVAGTWSGSTCSPPSAAIACYIGLTISQTGSTLSGTYGQAASSGRLTGNVVGSTVSMSMTVISPPTLAGGVWTVSVTVKGDQMTGTTSGDRRITATRRSR